MSDEDSERGRTVRVAGWWRRLAKRHIEEQGLLQRDLAKQLKTSEASISRDLGTNVNVDNVARLAALLDLPCPVYLPQTELEARAIADLLKRRGPAEREAALRAVDAQVAVISHVEKIGASNTKGTPTSAAALRRRRRRVQSRPD